MADLDPRDAPTPRTPTIPDPPRHQRRVRGARPGGIANDPDNPDLMDAQLVLMRPAVEVLPPDLYANLVKRGRPTAGADRDGSKLGNNMQM